jgi:hypothetical protein
MGDGGDGGEAIDYSAADIPVEFPTEAVMAAAGDGDDKFDDLLVTGISAGGEGEERRSDDEVIDLVWEHSDLERS